MKKKIGVLGSGVVGQALEAGFKKHGYEVRRAESRGQFADVAGGAEVVVLAVKGTAAVDALASVAAQVAGKVVVDTTNPIADAPPEHGVLKFFTGPNDSLMERLAAKVPAARLVKAFSCVGNAFMVDPKFAAKPTMFTCGDDDAAKADVRAILDAFGWETEDLGKAVAARAIEPLCMLWCIPGLRGGAWTHAFKLLKQ